MITLDIEEKKRFNINEEDICEISEKNEVCEWEKARDREKNRNVKYIKKQGQKLSIRMYVEVLIRSEGLKLNKSQNFYIALK